MQKRKIVKNLERLDFHDKQIRLEILELFANGILSSMSVDMFENDNRTEVITTFYYTGTDKVQTTITKNYISNETTIIGYYKNGNIRGKTGYLHDELQYKIMYNEDGSLSRIN